RRHADRAVFRRLRRGVHRELHLLGLLRCADVRAQCHRARVHAPAAATDGSEAARNGDDPHSRRTLVRSDRWSSVGEGRPVLNLAMRRAILVLLAATAWTVPVGAQSRIFVTGDVLADLKRFSGDPNTPTLDGNAIGGGAGVGALVGGRWSISLDADWSASTTRTTRFPIGVLETFGNALPIPVRQSPTTSNRLTTVSALLGYHARPTDRVSVGVFGGLSFVHVRRTVDFIPYAVPVSLTMIDPGVTLPLCCYPCCFQRQERVDNVPAATAGMEAAIDLGAHIAAVPQVRAHAFSLSDGGPGGFSIRPGIGIRWTF